MNNIIVTGANGFLGKHLCDRLKKKYSVKKISSGEIDLASDNAVELLTKLDSGHIVHLAGVSFVPDSWNDPKRFIRTNVMGTASVLEYCRLKKVPCTFISSYLYGNDPVNPIDETAPLSAPNPYALSKLMAEELCTHYHKFWGVTVSIIRPFNIYGPGQNENFLIPFLISQIKHQNEIRVKDLSPKRDYIHVSDVCSLIEKTIEKKANNICNAGSGISYSVAEVIAILQELAGTNKKVLSENQVRTGEISDTVASIELAKNVYKWSPLISLKDGLADLLNSSQ